MGREVRIDTRKGSIKLWLAPCEWRCRVYMWADLKLPHEGPRDVGGQGSEDHFTFAFLASLPFSKPLLGAGGHDVGEGVWIPALVLLMVRHSS